MCLQNALRTFDEPFIICFDLKYHKAIHSNFNNYRVGIFNSFAVYDTYLTELGL